MNRAEVVKVLKFLNTYYRTKFEYPADTTEGSKMLQDMWLMFLEDYNYEVVAAVIKKVALEKEWPPSPGEVIKAINIAMQPEDDISGHEAWNMVIDAINRYSAIYNPDKVIDSLPEHIAKTAEVIGLNKIAYNDEHDTYLQNSFINKYNEIKQHDLERDMLSGDIEEGIERIKRSEVEKLTTKFKTIEGGVKSN